MKVKGSQVGWVFWLQWVLASTVGMFVGFLMCALTLGDARGDWLTLSFVGIVLGIGVGVLQ